MDVEQLAETIFIKNRYDADMTFDINQHISGKQLSQLLYTLFMKGLVLLFGKDQKIVLNQVTEDQLEHVSNKLRLAHIKTLVEVVDKQTAILLDYIPENTHGIPLELYVMKENQSEHLRKPDNTDIREYVFQLFMNGRLIRVSFDIMRSLR
jgi:hypothetical protein